jgi:hypothetical protein
MSIFYYMGNPCFLCTSTVLLSCPFYCEDFCPLLVIIIVFCFLVSSEDADSLRIHTLSATGDIESIQKMVDDLDIEQGPSSSS